MQCEEWTDANSKLFKEVHDEAVHKNSYKRKLYELISASLGGSCSSRWPHPESGCPSSSVYEDSTIFLLSRLFPSSILR